MYEVLYDPGVLQDLKKLHSSQHQKILKQIHKKLPHSPQDYGRPLRHDLKGCWRLRVGDYRVIYEIRRQAKQVVIWLINQRKDDEVYIEFLKKLKNM